MLLGETLDYFLFKDAQHILRPIPLRLGRVDVELKRCPFFSSNFMPYEVDFAESVQKKGDRL